MGTKPSPDFKLTAVRRGDMPAGHVAFFMVGASIVGGGYLEDSGMVRNAWQMAGLQPSLGQAVTAEPSIAILAVSEDVLSAFRQSLDHMAALTQQSVQASSREAQRERYMREGLEAAVRAMTRELRGGSDGSGTDTEG